MCVLTLRLSAEVCVHTCTCVCMCVWTTEQKNESSGSVGLQAQCVWRPSRFFTEELKRNRMGKEGVREVWKEFLFLFFNEIKVVL